MITIIRDKKLGGVVNNGCQDASRHDKWKMTPARCFFDEISLQSDSNYQLPWDAQGSPRKKTIGTRRLQTLSVTSVFSFFSHHANRSLCIISSSMSTYAIAISPRRVALQLSLSNWPHHFFAKQTRDLKGEAVPVTQCTQKCCTLIASIVANSEARASAD